MSKYKVGDVVKLRDDLEINKKYGGITFTNYKNEFKNESIKVIEISEGDDTYRIIDEDKNAGWISEEMIEGLWEEYKSTEQVSKSEGKYKLIDILNKIANGELKEGTKVIVIEGKEEYTYRICPEDEENHELVNEDGEHLFNNYYVDIISSEVELIEPHEPTECEHEWKIGGIRDTIDPLEVVAFQHCEKCGMTKIMETKKQENHKEAEHFRDDTKMIEPTDNTKIEELDKEEMLCLTLQCAIAVLTDKLNDVINKVNIHSTVLLAQEKDIKEIQEELDY